MISYKYLKEIVDPKYFDLPTKPVKSKLTAFKLGYTKNCIEIMAPYVYLCNKTSIFDKDLVSATLKCDFVFLKDEVIKKLYVGTLSKTEQTEIFEKCKELKNQFISIVIFPEKNQTVFGDTDNICKSVTDFLFELQFDIKFLALVGTYLTAPIWSHKVRHANTKFICQNQIKSSELKKMSKDEFFDYINNHMPSSASVYSTKFPIYIRSNELAENIETILYCCPNCGKFFKLYSEYNCVKCKNCGSAIEFQPTGEVLFAKNAKNYDELKTFQLSNLTKFANTTEPVVSYESVMRCVWLPNGKLDDLIEAKVSTFTDKVTIDVNDFHKKINFSDVFDIDFLPHNVINIETRSNETITLQGKHKENLLIILDLFDEYKKNKTK